MSIPSWIPMLGLNNDLELGPNCPPEEDAPSCNQCPDKDCDYRRSE